MIGGATHHQAITNHVNHLYDQAFGYDELNRLTSASGNYGNFTYAYDPLGNMTSKEGVTMSYGLPNGTKPHAVTSVTEPRGTFSLTYDANGNLLQKRSPVSGLLSQVFEYDAENRLVRVDTPKEETITLTFSPGWNFFSLPVIPDDLSIASIFPNFSTDFEQIALASSLQPPAFSHYVGHPDFNDFETLEYGQGYQIYCKATSPVTLQLTGSVPTQQQPQSLPPGRRSCPQSRPGTSP